MPIVCEERINAQFRLGQTQIESHKGCSKRVGHQTERHVIQLETALLLQRELTHHHAERILRQGLQRKVCVQVTHVHVREVELRRSLRFGKDVVHQVSIADNQ